MARGLNYIDLFAGAGGLSEGFIEAGFNPIAHVEMDTNASDTLRTRLVYHYLKQKNFELYKSYLKGEIDRNELWDCLPEELNSSVINEAIGADTIKGIFDEIDNLRGGQSVDLIIGGPPCQAYSIVGRSRDPDRMRNDARNYLFKYYAKFLQKYKPKYFVFENVLGLLSAGYSMYLKEMLKLFTDMGYSADYRVLKAEEYGVLQKRRRVIIIGRRGKRKFEFPEIVRIDNPWKVKPDILCDLPVLSQGEEQQTAKYIKSAKEYLKVTGIRNGINFTTQHIARPHNDRDLEIYSIAIDKWLNDNKRLRYTDLPKKLQSHNNLNSFLDRYKVVDPNGYSHTMVAHIAKDGHYYIYPDQSQVRSISVREAARIQSFSDDYYFEGGRSAAFKQIGNAVPPLMAEAIAKSIKNLI